MNRKETRGQKIGLSLIGLLFFTLCMPLFVQMGGGAWLLAEVLPGQVSRGTISVSRLWDSDGSTAVGASATVWGVDDVEFHRKSLDLVSTAMKEITADELNQMKDFAYLKNNYYIVDSRTTLTPGDVNVTDALSQDFTIDTNTNGDQPKVLLFHTHSHEGFADSDMSKGLQEGIWGTGEELKRILEDDYGIAVYHDDGQYDVVDGKGQILGAYERMEPRIRQILKDNPSIEVCIDMHRDGVAESTRLVSTVDGVECAQVMFFDGLCRLNKNGTAQAIDGLDNPYLEENLAFSLQMQVIAGQNFPGLTRKIYLGAYRFSLHMLPRSTLIEVGAQTNTKAEAKNAMAPLAKVLATVLKEETS